MKIRIVDEAYGDLVRARAFYERRQQGLGAHFLDVLIRDIDSLAWRAGIHAVTAAGTHRMFSRTFPHAIDYIVDDDVAVVLAIQHCSAEPKRIVSLLRRRRRRALGHRTSPPASS